MATWKAWTAVAEYRLDQSGIFASRKEFTRDPSIGDAPVRGGIPFQDAQSVQAIPIQGRECGGIEAAGNKRILLKRGPDRPCGPSVCGEFGGSSFTQCRPATGQTGAGSDQFYPRSQAVSLA